MTDGVTVVWPTLTYADAPAAIRFLVEALGFEARAVFPGEAPGEVSHAELRWPGGGGVMLSTVREGSDVQAPSGRGSIYVVTDDIDTRFDRAVAAGARVIRPPVDEDYGGRDFVVADLEGVLWCLGTYAGAESAT